MSEGAPEITVEALPSGSGGRANVIVKIPGQDPVIDRIVLTDAKAREQFADKVCQACPSAERAHIISHLTQAAADMLEELAESEEIGSDAADLMALVRNNKEVELFHCPDRLPYVTVPVGDYRETFDIDSADFREWLSFQYFEANDRAPSASAIQQTIATLMGYAKHRGPTHEIHVRLAGRDGNVWLDLNDEERRAVCITPHGWRVVVGNDVPIKFVRRFGMHPIPAPTRGGSIDYLRSLVNVPDDEDWILVVGWLIGCFHPTGPYAVLALSGTYGSAKSTTCKVIRRLIDPNLADVRRPPTDEREIFVASSNSWIIAFNNLSELKPHHSDALCAVATDGGYAVRAHYTNSDEVIFSARRPILLNGIDEVVGRSDLVDRSLAIALPRIPETQRSSEAEIFAKFERLRPGILGALLDAVSAALRCRDQVRLERSPRVADLAIWMTAAERGMGWPEGRFVDAVFRNRAVGHVLVVEASPFGPALLSLLDKGPFRGSATELLERLNHQVECSARPKGWPSTPKELAAEIRRIVPDLEAVGVSVQLPVRRQGRNKKRVFGLEKVADPRAARAAWGDGEPDAAHAAHAAHPPATSESSGAPEVAP
jgi:hypothetical protein